jgi:hypothetical protein
VILDEPAGRLDEPAALDAQQDATLVDDVPRGAAVPTAGTFNREQRSPAHSGTVGAALIVEGEKQERAMESPYDAAEAARQQHEAERQAAEAARKTAEQSRVSAEAGRREVADEVSGTIATLTTLVTRMEVVEALRRDAHKGP